MHLEHGDTAGWRTVIDPLNELRVHVVPVEDAMPHKLEWTYCNCGPTLDLGADVYGSVIVHHSLDGRELLEDAP